MVTWRDVKKKFFVDTVVFSEKRLAKLVFFSWSSSGKAERGLLQCFYLCSPQLPLAGIPKKGKA